MGALIKGNDIRVANTTIQEAKAWCLANSSCFGFTARSTACNAAITGPVYFKGQESTQNPDPQWYTYLRDDAQPCGPAGGLDEWSVVPSTTLQGTSEIILSNLSKAPVAAVRFAWRGYPCEHLGCGLYSSDGIPPPPFHFWTNQPHNF